MPKRTDNAPKADALHEDMAQQIEQVGKSIEALIRTLRRRYDLPELDRVLLKLGRAVAANDEE